MQDFKKMSNQLKFIYIAVSVIGVSVFFSVFYSKRLINQNLSDLSTIQIPAKTSPPINKHIFSRKLADNNNSDSKTETLNRNMVKNIYEAQNDVRQQVIQMKDVEPAERLWALMPTINCAHEVRLGAILDGGKWLCAPWLVQRRDCNIVSLGIGSTASFDFFVTQLLPECHLYALDNAANAQKYLPKVPNIHFRAATLIAHDRSPTSSSVSLKRLLFEEWKLKSIFVWKMDLEEYEYELLPVLLTNGTGPIVPICQLLIETHPSTRQKPKERIQDFLSLMKMIFNSGFELFHVEPNQYCFDIERYLGECNEWAFIHRDCLSTFGLKKSDILYEPF